MRSTSCCALGTAGFPRTLPRSEQLSTRGTNENTNGLLRQYFPKRTDLARWNREDLDAIAATLNSRPRKVLGWKTPAEALNELLLSLQNSGVATTG
jgi:hypothetical protein